MWLMLMAREYKKIFAIYYFLNEAHVFRDSLAFTTFVVNESFRCSRWFVAALHLLLSAWLKKWIYSWNQNLTIKKKSDNSLKIFENSKSWNFRNFETSNIFKDQSDFFDNFKYLQRLSILFKFSLLPDFQTSLPDWFKLRNFEYFKIWTKCLRFLYFYKIIFRK